MTFFSSRMLKNQIYFALEFRFLIEVMNLISMNSLRFLFLSKDLQTRDMKRAEKKYKKIVLLM